MTEESNIPEEIKIQAMDYVAAGARSVLGAAPFVGSLLVELVGTVIPNQRIDRIAKFASALERRMSDLEKSKIKNEFSDEAFTELLEESLRQAARSHSDERREYLASLVANSLTDDEVTHSEHRHLLRILGDVSDVEIIWLRSFVPFYASDPDAFRTTHASTLQRVSAHLGSPQWELDKHALQESYIAHLVGLGLLKRALKLDRNKEPVVKGGAKEFEYSSPSLTSLGRMLLRLVNLMPENGI